jgi:hypothetical protein
MRSYNFAQVSDGVDYDQHEQYDVGDQKDEVDATGEPIWPVVEAAMATAAGPSNQK